MTIETQLFKLQFIAAATNKYTSSLKSTRSINTKQCFLSWCKNDSIGYQHAKPKCLSINETFVVLYSNASPYLFVFLGVFGSSKLRSPAFGAIACKGCLVGSLRINTTTLFKQQSQYKQFFQPISPYSLLLILLSVLFP